MSLFRSIKFNVILFVIIAALSALGTFIPQTADNGAKVSEFLANNPTWGKILNSWGFFNIYHTFLFAALLALMAFDVVVCKLWNKPPDPGLIPLPAEQTREELSLQALRKKPHRLEGTLEGSPAHIAKNVMQRLKKQSYSVKKVNLPGGGTALLASRHRAQRWGSYVSHISLVVILVGALLKSLLGFETFLPVLEGQAANVTEPLFATLSADKPLDDGKKLTPMQRLNAIARIPGDLHKKLQRTSLDPIANWTLSVEKMTVDFYQNSATPSTFASKIRLYDLDKPLADTTIRVNQPLDVRRVRFYQASWGVTGMIRGSVLRVGNKTIDANMKEFFPVPGQPWLARVEHYLPDFTISSDGQPTTASLEWKNPALVIGFYNKKKDRLGTLAVSAPSPVTPADAKPWGYLFMGGGHIAVQPPIQVLGVQPILFSGVQVTYDPGYPVIFTGVIFMLLGLGALFYLHQRRVIVFIRPGTKDEEVRVDIGGWSSRGEKEFAHEFKSLFRSLDLSEVGTA
jgi:cytochrome c biogenesis protein